MGGVLLNDTDAEEQTLTAILVADVQNGELTLNADGSASYVPDAGFVGTDTFTYRASDGTLESNVATVTITVSASPTADNDAYEVDEDQTLTVTAAQGVIANDDDPEDDDLTAVLDDEPEHGSLVFSDDGSFQYVPDEDFHGTDGFSYHLSDGHSLSLVAAVTITVRPINDAPLAANNSFTVLPGATLSIDDPGVLAGDSDIDGDSLTAVFSADPANGTLSLAADGSFTYTPDSGFHGFDTFPYLADDGDLTDEATVTILVNTTPTVQEDSYATDEDVPLDVAAEDGLLDNDNDADGDTLSITIVTGPAHGSLTPNTATGSFLYTPAADYSGPDSFTYRVSDGFVDSELATVTIQINAANDAPQAVANTYSVEQDTTLSIDEPSGVLANDEDVDSPTLIASLVTDVQHGDLTLNGDGSFTYVPDAGFLGNDSFVYEVSDGADSSQATVTLNVFEGGGEGEGVSAAELALLLWLAGEEADGNWEAAVDQVFAELG
jgi:VCBS repeat-containing protein